MQRSFGRTQLILTPALAASPFDRKFAERYWPVFEHKAWGCSMSEIDWRKHGFAGARLGYLLTGAGYFHESRRAAR